MTDIKNASQRSNPERSSFEASEHHERSLSLTPYKRAQ